MAKDLSKEHQGCSGCGLIGCECGTSKKDVKDSFANLCKRCGADPCECEGKPMKLVQDDVCVVCRRHRALCICQSHHIVKTTNDPGVLAATRPTRPYLPEYVEHLVNEAMQFYYQRDAEGLARWMRRVLPRSRP